MGWFSGSRHDADEGVGDGPAPVWATQATGPDGAEEELTQPLQSVREPADAADTERTVAVPVHGDLSLEQPLVFEPRAREIAHKAARPVLEAYSEDTSAVAVERVERFHDELVATMADRGDLNAFLDPAFETLLRKAQLAAASTSDPADHALLALLLADSATSTDRMTLAGIDRAVSVVNLLDADSLSALTVAVALRRLGPTAGGVHEGLAGYDQMLSQLTSGDLPTGAAWLDHLDTLGAIRVSQTLRTESLAELVARLAPGYCCAGIEIGSETEKRAGLRLTEVGLALIRGINHELRPGYSRFSHRDLRSFRAALEAQGLLDEEQIEALLQVAEADMGLDVSEPSLIPALGEAMAAHSTLARVQSWWDGIEVRFEVTGVGLVLARANTQRVGAGQILDLA